MGYILITPAKNEVSGLPALAACIAGQTVPPLLWVIVDDGSSDDTPVVVAGLEERYAWIESVRKPTGRGYSHLAFAEAQRDGYERAVEICRGAGIGFEYVGKLDADISIPKDYFEALVLTLDADPGLAFVAGRHRTAQEGVVSDVPVDLFSAEEVADERLYKREFIKEAGGFPLSYSPDTVLAAKARLLGWRFALVPGTWFVEQRQLTPRSLWMRYRSKGVSRYYLHYHPVLVYAKVAAELMQPPRYQACAMLSGYLGAWLRRLPRIEDASIAEYFRHRRYADFMIAFRRAREEEGGYLGAMKSLFRK